MSCAPWPIDIEACCVATNVAPEDPRVASVIMQVTEMMTRWSGFAYGGCGTVRPLDPCSECRSGCCSSGDCIVLHNASAVTEVRVLGEVVDAADYHFLPSRGTLCAVPPLRWPTRDPLHLTEGEMEVDVTIGAAPDAWTLAVASELACELLRSCAGKDCRLPDNATQVTSQGVTVTLSDDEINHLLPSVSAWVAAVNPASATMPARIFSPEAKRAAVVGSSMRSTRWR